MQFVREIGPVGSDSQVHCVQKGTWPDLAVRIADVVCLQRQTRRKKGRPWGSLWFVMSLM
jgi:hypothetical protein